VITPDVADKLRRVELLVLDVDGVLTDGTLQYGGEGEVHKTFHVRDGLGVRQLIENGVDIAVITGRRSDALGRRLQELRVTHVYVGRNDKANALAELLDTVSLGADRVAYVGDDVLDLPAMRKVGVSITPADGHPAVRRQADWITEAKGGHGAVREIADEILRARNNEKTGEFKVIIPARMAAQRLPGKPLREIAGRAMITHVIDRANEAGAEEVLVATDNELINACVEEYGARAILTSPDHASGTDRLAEVVDSLGWDPDTIVVNLQGDEPALSGAYLRGVANALADNPKAGIATLATRISGPAELFNTDVVKVVIDDASMASYFSRAPIPWVRGVFTLGVMPEHLPIGIPFFRHIGVYAYRAAVLRRIARTPRNHNESAESLEQLRALALGINIHVSVTDKAPPPGVDTEEDLARVDREMSK